MGEQDENARLNQLAPDQRLKELDQFRREQMGLDLNIQKKPRRDIKQQALHPERYRKRYQKRFTKLQEALKGLEPEEVPRKPVGRMHNRDEKLEEFEHKKRAYKQKAANVAFHLF